jgi:hypothetical protein
MILWRWTKPAVKWWMITFVIGDDWRIAARIGGALLATWGLVQAGAPAWWLLPLAALYETACSVRREVARER